MRELKACIFDLDGVICDTAKYHYLAWKSLGSELGINFTKQDNERLKGISRMESLEILLSLGSAVYSEKEKLMMAEVKNSNYLFYIEKMGKKDILPGVLDMLDYCRQNGLKTALGSVSKNAMLILERLELKPYFDVIVDGTMVKNAKPNPEVFLTGAHKMNVKASECVVFEDACSGIEAARAANMAAVGIGDAVTLNNASMVIKGFDEIKPQKLLAQAAMIGDMTCIQR